MNTDWHDLMQRHIAGLTTEEEAELLHNALKQDDGLARLYLRYMNLDVALEAHAGSQAAVTEMLGSPQRSESKRWANWLSWRPLAAAAAAAILLVLGAVWLTGGSSAPGVRAIVTAGEKLPPSLRVGEAAVLGRFSLAEGRVALRLENGVALELLAPVEAEFVNAMRLKVSRGQITADVGELGKGFVIETAVANVVDLGTKFGVVVGAGGQTDVVVFDGTVEVREPSAKGANHLMASLTAGEGVRVNSQVTQRIAALSGGQREDDWTVSTHASSGVIADVRDNVMLPDFHQFYLVTPRGLDNGARAYTDRIHPRWNAQGGEALPAWLAGADVVRTFHVSRNRKNFALTLTLSRPATVFVFLDLRKPVPDWLAREFTNTGVQLRLGPWNAGGVIQSVRPANGEPAFIPCSVWRRDVPTAGEVTLGPPHEIGDARANAMYGVAAKALP